MVAVAGFDLGRREEAIGVAVDMQLTAHRVQTRGEAA
jgi:hypothetical protein